MCKDFFGECITYHGMMINPLTPNPEAHLSNCQAMVDIHSCDSPPSIALTEIYQASHYSITYCTVLYAVDRCFYCTMGSIHMAKRSIMHPSCLSEGFDAQSFCALYL